MSILLPIGCDARATASANRDAAAPLQSCVDLPRPQADGSAEPGPPEPVWRVSWSVTGNILAVSSGESDVTLYKEELDAQRAAVTGREAKGTQAVSSWKIVGELDGPGAA